MKKALPIIFTLVVAFLAAKAQQADTSINETNKIFLVVDTDPTFPGGIENFNRYLAHNLRYPQQSRENRIQGRVFVTFVVEKDGSLTDVKVVKNVSQDIDAEALKVVKSSPLWVPGMINGKPVRTQFTIPINFRLPPDVHLYISKGFKDTTINDFDKVFFTIERDPVFPGGIDNLYQYLSTKFNYPRNVDKNNIQGDVDLTFIVERDGSLTNIVIVNGVSKQIDDELLKLMMNCPKWEPGTEDWDKERVRYALKLNLKRIFQPDISVLKPDTGKIFTAVQQGPTFPGGVENFYRYLQKNMRYPEYALTHEIQGKVLLTFIVEKDGRLTDLKVVKSVSKELDAEAVRVMSACPNWNPGLQNGHAVRVQFTMPISFTLSN